MSHSLKAFILALSLIVITAGSSIAEVPVSFVQKDWLKYENREKMAQDFIDTSCLIGKKPDEVHKLLGPAHIDYQPPVQDFDVYPLNGHASDSSSTKFFTVPGLEIKYNAGLVTSLRMTTCRVRNKEALPGLEPKLE